MNHKVDLQEEHRSSVRRGCARPAHSGLSHGERQQRFAKTGGWGYAVFNHDNATGTMKADAAKEDCGHVCHLAVAKKDYIFHPYQKR